MKLPFVNKEPTTDNDPVCGMEVEKSNPPGGASRHEGVTYIFCGYQCKETFDAEPEKYARAASQK